MLSYINSKNNRVAVVIKRHAILKFCDRYERLFNESISCKEAEAYIIYSFPCANRVVNLNKKEKDRIKKHGHTLYFRTSPFTYVVHNGVVITVEISDNGKRHLNK